ncbi:MAG: YlxM family DNA-binding protein [Acetivibrio ethanolgignens]
MKEIEDVYELSLLYDFYGALLKEQKREVFEDYILNDLSLGEIARERGISRQGIHDSIKRCSRELFDYEERLGLVQKFNCIKEKVGDIHQAASKLEEAGTVPELKKIVALSDEILEEL